LPNYVTPKLGPDYLSGLDNFDVIVRSPGVHPRELVAANSPEILQKVTTCINEFFAKCPAPIIGVTGTKGKGTTSTLIYEMLLASGKKPFLGGNIGIVPLNFLHEVTADSVVVLELSSFQLIDFTGHPRIAVCLMVAPEHLDWHANKEEYFAAKERLFAQLTVDDRLVFNGANGTTTRIISASQASKIPYYVPLAGQENRKTQGAYVLEDTIYYQDTAICNINEVGLLGRHNLENVCAAITAVWPVISGNIEAIRKIVSNFKGLEHRLELVREVSGVQYYNDSFATTPEATIAAVRAFKQPKVLILGGHDKGIPFFDLVGELTHANVRQIIYIGDTGPKIAEMLTNHGVENVSAGGNTMTEIVTHAKGFAQPGDVVLLSTACASFGLFKDYKDRGNQFKQAVKVLV
jgi:UDP-N-acetylmuramoylalanine--D-glutamate ligase